METEGLSGSLTCLRWQTWGWRQGLASAKLRTRELPCGSHVFSLASDQFNNLSSLLSLWPLPSSFACVFPSAPEDVTKPEPHRWGWEVERLGV